MGRPSDSDVPLEPIEHDSHPPLYNDVIESPSSTPVNSIPGGWECTWDDKLGTRTLHPSLSNDPHALFRFISDQHKVPPQQYVSIKGLKDKANDSTHKEVAFDFKLDLTPTLLRLGESDSDWHELQITRDGDGKKAYRGGPVPSLEWEQPSGQGNRHKAIDLEGNDDLEDQTLLDANLDGSNEGNSNLMTWCERFCHDPAGVKSFTFTRELEGFDAEPLCSELKSYLRSTDFRGQIKITTSTQNTFVVHSVWRSSCEIEDTSSPHGLRKIYAHGRDETKLADFWAPAVVQAARDQRDEGEVLTEGSIQRLQQRAQERMRNVASFLPET
ncbi:unnamed protein product [Penicillium bialowiezense]